MTANVDVIPIYQLFGKDFFIPDYQRGYRWEKQEITDLLKDLYEYAKAHYNHETTSKFYCLQPLVVKEKQNGAYEVIDGQQRLTTIYLILNYLNNKNPFKLTYETRTNCHDFFENREYLKIVSTNPDFYHISKGYDYIKEWFEKTLPEEDRAKAKFYIAETINGKENFNARFIWYETIQDSIELFTSMNEEKIPLTDAELIKALLFQSDKYKKPYGDVMKLDSDIKQNIDTMSSEWDAYSCKLQDDRFWYFLNHKDAKSSKRLEYIFSLIAEKWNNEGDEKLISYTGEKPKHYVYLIFFEKLKSLTDKDSKSSFSAVQKMWQDVKEYFTILEEWYNDNEWFHLFGYYVAVSEGVSAFKEISDLLIMFSDRTKTKDKEAFKTIIKEKIGEHLKNLLDKKKLKDFTYHDSNNKPLIDILLLFNVDSIAKCNNENARFPFDLYSKQKVTSLEHIHPQNPQNLEENQESAKNWLNVTESSLNRIVTTLSDTSLTKGQALIERIGKLKQNYSREDFVAFYNDYYNFYNSLIMIDNITTRKEFLEKEFPDLSENNLNEIIGADFEDTIFNLALVDKDTNSALNNSSFDAKREILNQRESSDCYVPLCTRRVFTKYYSPKSLDILYWQPEDRIRYFITIKKVVDKYISIYKSQKK
jgi:uncharacterized protein with ParB-like and HNH nuclease domain